MSQSEDSPSVERVGLPYEEAGVWSMQFMRSPQGGSKDYLSTLGADWRMMMDEAKNRSLIKDYRIMLAPLHHVEDWDVLIAIEVENMAALDGYSERMDALASELRGSSGGCSTIQETHGRPPDLVGMKLAREVRLR